MALLFFDMAVSAANIKGKNKKEIRKKNKILLIIMTFSFFRFFFFFEKAAQ